MDEMNFGDVLRQAREQSGEDLVSVARRIRIRPDILERIEDSDIDAMPPRGYSRNMINAYARYLGLNTTEVVKMYQNAQYRSQVEHARENMRPSGFDMPATRREGMRERSHEHARPRAAASASARPEPRAESRAAARRASGGFDDALFDDIDASSAPANQPSSRIGAVHVGSYNAYGQGLSRRNARRESDETRRLEPVDEHARRGAQDMHRARRSTMPGEHYTNLYAAPKNIGIHASSWRDKMPFVVAGLLVLLVVAAIAVFANGMTRAQAPEQASAPINVTGLPGSSSSTSSQEDDDQASDAQASQDAASSTQGSQEEAAPTKTVVAYDIPAGVSTYFEAYVDGKYVDGGDVTGPKSQSYDVTGIFEFHVTPPDGVTLTQDGTEVPLEAGASGVAKATIDFADVLSAWNEEHGASSSGAGSAA